MYPQPLPTSMSPEYVLWQKQQQQFLIQTSSGTTNELIVDRGCSEHMFHTNVQLTDYNVKSNYQKYVQVANGHRVPVLGIGCCGLLTNVYYVPALSHSLLSVRALAAEGFNKTFTSDNVTITFGGSIYRFEPIISHVIDGLYRISQADFELRSQIPHQSCLGHRVQE